MVGGRTRSGLGLLLGAAVLGWAALGGVAPRTASAQAPAPAKEIRLKPVLGGRPVNLSNGDVTNDAQFDEYYKWFLCRITWEEWRLRLPELRRVLRVEFATLYRGSYRAHKALLKLTADAMAVVMLDDAYSIPARVNAALVLGSLNDKEGTTDAVPHRAAAPTLLRALNSSIPVKASNDAVRAAALASLLRVCAPDLAPEIQAEVANQLLPILNAKQAPAGRTPEAHAWMRRRACDVLGAIGAPEITKDGGEIARALAAILADKTAPLAVRCDAARAFGDLRFTSSPAVSLAGVCHGLADLAVAVARSEAPAGIKRPQAASVLAALRGGEPAGSGKGALTVATGDEKDYVAAGGGKIQAVAEAIVADGAAINAVVSDLEQWWKANPPKTGGLAAG